MVVDVTHREGQGEGPGSASLPVLLIARFDDAQHSHPALQQRALERLGCRVTRLPLERDGWLARLAHKDLSTRLERAFNAIRPRLVLTAGNSPLRQELVQPLRTGGAAQWVHWFYEDGSAADLVPDASGVADHVFVADRETAAEQTRRLGRPVHFLAAAADPSFHRPLRAREPYRANVTFVGSMTPHRERVLESLVEFGLGLWGPGWKRSRLREYCRGELISAEDAVRAWAGATVAVNVHREHDASGACNRRLFEIAAVGTPQVTDRRAGLSALYRPGEELLVYRDTGELPSLVRALLPDAPRREALAAAARRTTLHQHTYMHRMREMLEVLGVRSEK